MTIFREHYNEFQDAVRAIERAWWDVWTSDQKTKQERDEALARYKAAEERLAAARRKLEAEERPTSGE